MTSTQILRFPVGVALAVSLTGCAGLPRIAHWAPIKPVNTAAVQPTAREDGYYAGASAAISRRDYAEALDLLQAARARKPDDARVLNAFGVVYDKLGRFDLSARYYEQARQLDPASAVVAANVTYSAVLRARSELPLAEEVAPIAQERPVLAVAPSPYPSVIRLGFAPQAIALAPAAAGRVGFAVEIADASGAPAQLDSLRRGLIRLGWSTPRIVLPRTTPAPYTTITYPARSVAVARGLANTLPARVRMVECADTCDRIRLVIGVDAAKWRLDRRYAALAQGD